MIQENHIAVSRTARYYTLGELSSKTKQVWFVLHGWGMNAKDFITQFEPLLTEEVFFIAPEALSRFYLKDSEGKVGATWMTKEDRLNEIKDYISYLDSLYAHFGLEKIPSAKIVALGFSQGSATLTRWLNSSSNKVDVAIVHSGDVAPELLPLKETSGLNRTKNYIFYGTKDEYFPLPLIHKMLKNYRSLNFAEVEFDGGHEVIPELLKKHFFS